MCSVSGSFILKTALPDERSIIKCTINKAKENVVDLRKRIAEVYLVIVFVYIMYVQTYTAETWISKDLCAARTMN